MSFLITQPEMVGAAASNLAAIGSLMAARNAAAAWPTAGMAPAAADPVSVLTSARFVQHAQVYQQIAAQAAAVHEQLVATLRVSAGSYAATDAANATATS